MAVVTQINSDRFGYDFIPPEFLPPGKDEYWLRNTQTKQGITWRNITKEEQDILLKNNNTCSNWNNFLVRDPFNPALIQNSHFFGLIRIGELSNVLLRHHDFSIPAGIRNSTIISCDIGDNTAIQDCAYISHYIIGDACILSRIDELQTTNHSKFGNGVLTEGEDENVRVWIDVMNEAGGRSILPFTSMIPADAFLWAAYRDDAALVEALKNITQSEYGGHRGHYGTIGSHSTVKSCLIMKDVFIGEYAYIKGANKLKNISVLSSEDEPTQIGEGVEMVNGIVGYGCNAFYGIKAVRFVMGRRSSLKYGARLIHSVLGDNSNVSCCELLNNLIYPVHEQHHNNSFLIATLIQGMSNMAAGATIGSNHNSRANDGEIRAGRGFWPGLSATLKHSSNFASFVLVVKGDYPNELNITLPFSLVSNNARLDRLEVMPAYFWMHNLYALERNTWKTRDRDRRFIKKQIIETDYLAPDTVNEIINALEKMEGWIKNIDDEEDVLSVTGLEPDKRQTILLKPRQAIAAYREMLLFYSLKTLAEFLEKNPELSYKDFLKECNIKNSNSGAESISSWVNLGGQIVPAWRLDKLREEIGSGKIKSWKEIHAYYESMADSYLKDKAIHAFNVYSYLKNSKNESEHPLCNNAFFIGELETLKTLYKFIEEQVYQCRVKDLNDPFRGITYRNKEELDAVLGDPKDNSFIKFINSRTIERIESLGKLQERLS